MRTIDVLTGAREMITHPAAWTTLVLSAPSSEAPRKAAYCALGAIYYLDNCHSDDWEAGTEAVRAAMYPQEVDKAREWNRENRPDLVGYNGYMETNSAIAGFNNASTHEEVLALFDRAIARQLVIDSMAQETIMNEPVRLAELVG